ncbi:MAG: MFS transporter [Clostridia bacterium]|nr:MFS transporter [Clostridia bacterium]
MEYTEEKILKAKKFNRKIFPIYKMFSWDLLFYYSVSFLFLTQVKGFSASNVLLFDAFYTVFKFLSQIPSINITEIIGKRKSLLIANIFVSLSILTLILTQEMWHAILANAFMGIGYSLKTLVDSVFLRDQIVIKEHPGTAFSNLDGKGSAFWYAFDAITSISCGFLFVFNAYLPMALCLSMCIISCILAFTFKPYEDLSKKVKLEESGSYKQYIKDLKIAFKNIFKSRRLKALFLFSGMFAALLTMRSTVASSLFIEISIPEQYFGIIFAGLTMLSAIASKFQNIFHTILRNRVLTYFSLVFSLSLIVVGLTAMFSMNFVFTIIVVISMYALQYIIKGPYYTLIKRYLNSFSSSTMAPKIFSVNTLVESLFSTVMCYLASILLEHTLTANAVAILGCVFLIAFIFILDYMKDKIGLKPEEYEKKDINFTEVH